MLEVIICYRNRSNVCMRANRKQTDHEFVIQANPNVLKKSVVCILLLVANLII